jgi:hypothetical protein
MIPEFNEDGYLPPGIRPATLEEVAARFGQESEVRRNQMESLRWLVDLARGAGVQRLVVNGSFVSDKLDPNDVDCVLLIRPGFPRAAAAEAALLAGLTWSWRRRRLENTRAKLQRMEQLYERLRQEPAEDEHVRELTLRSLKKRINQFKEEMIRFECRLSSARQDG